MHTPRSDPVEYLQFHNFQEGWNRSGMGKRGGIRIIYYNVTRNGRIYLALIYPKNEQDDLTEEQRKALKLLSEKLL